MNNKTCGECKHYIAMSRCTLYRQFVHDDDCCGDYAPKPQPITNGDRIRQMSNEELAQFMSENRCKHCFYYIDTKEGLARKCGYLTRSGTVDCIGGFKL